MSTLKIHVKQHICTGEAICTGIDPRHFEMITNGAGEHKAMVRDPDGSLHEQSVLNVPDKHYDETLEAGERCPPKAIYIWELDDDGEEEQLCP